VKAGRVARINHEIKRDFFDLVPTFHQLKAAKDVDFHFASQVGKRQDLSQGTVARILEQPDQYRATMMIATTMNAATSERTRSSVFDLGFGAASGGGIAYVGGCSSPANQPTASDFMGSNAIMICST
jgi:hypothetical protein